MSAPRRRAVPWVEDIPRRIKLDRTARDAYPNLTFSRRQRPTGAVYLYEVALEVPGYDDRTVRVEFHANSAHSARTPRIYADGPTDSKHRYDAHQLCIWHPCDKEDQRWVPEDGLLTLLGMTAAHLFKEAYWRETGDWLGEEAPHETLTPADDSAKKDFDTPSDHDHRTKHEERRHQQ